MTARIAFDAASGKFVGYVNGKVVKRSKERKHVEEKVAALSGKIGRAHV